MKKLTLLQYTKIQFSFIRKFNNWEDEWENGGFRQEYSKGSNPSKNQFMQKFR